MGFAESIHCFIALLLSASIGNSNKFESQLNSELSLYVGCNMLGTESTLYVSKFIVCGLQTLVMIQDECCNLDV